MSGHSKWANIKHRKEKSDSAKAQAFTRVTREIIIAAREGGGDPEGNFRLRLAIQNARGVNMPNDNIQRAIKRGSGGEDGANLEQVNYEGYGPAGVAVIVETMTDNRNRTAGDVRHLFSKYGGNLGENGCVAWMFDRKGYLVVEMEDKPFSEEQVSEWAIESGAEDLETGDGIIEIYTAPEDLQTVQEYLESKGVEFAESENTMIAQNEIALDEDAAQRVAKMLEALEELDDVQKVHSNLQVNVE
ncbi:MAG TPA: YebC/PmpR family DNA-binding transcriptional regulator [Firmicutes bacterium]|jgi:YebC/PmpR family DNA-binding regulatory protein|nr:YebC/PmpR family DNA-binding transcriptional regulator [Bacillota bacterium]HBL67331.1 YebC/PmpR family DNA-binding transcriptional regulator [Bacillota bacterium]HCF92185.1 YebC/PmpR family DNA-binding transcriptional regulator [Bacillota bacterium]HCT37087.1 YebC/PmpR family DNA-binding transcriptional regulator [Bacillota bacterium]